MIKKQNKRQNHPQGQRQQPFTSWACQVQKRVNDKDNSSFYKTHTHTIPDTLMISPERKQVVDFCFFWSIFLKRYKIKLTSTPRPKLCTPRVCKWVSVNIRHKQSNFCHLLKWLSVIVLACEMQLSVAEYLSDEVTGLVPPSVLPFPHCLLSQTVFTSSGACTAYCFLLCPHCVFTGGPPLQSTHSQYRHRLL